MQALGGRRKRSKASAQGPRKKRLELAYVAESGEVKQPDKKKILETAYLAVGGKIQQPADKSPDLPEVAAIGEIKQSDSQSITQSGKKTVSKAVKEYLKDCDDRKGRSGYGLASRTPETYEYRLGFLIEFRPEVSLEEVDVYLIFDRGSSFNAEMIDVVRSFGIQPKRTNFRSLWQNGVAERWVGNCRLDFLDNVIVLNKWHFIRLMNEYVRYSMRTGLILRWRRERLPVVRP